MPFPALATSPYTLNILVICKTGGLKGLKGKGSPGIEEYLNFGRSFFKDISLKVASTWRAIVTIKVTSFRSSADTSLDLRCSSCPYVQHAQSYMELQTFTSLSSSARLK